MWPGDIEKREGEWDGSQAGSRKEEGEGWVDKRKGRRHDTDVPSPDVAYQGNFEVHKL